MISSGVEMEITHNNNNGEYMPVLTSVESNNHPDVYCVVYVHTDKPEYSEVLGVYASHDDAVRGLLESAGYREDSQHRLTQYHEVTDEYPSYKHLYEQVKSADELHDVDIYRISRERVRRVV